jgi:hypothetical protein
LWNKEEMLEKRGISAALDLSDVVEVFFHEEEGVNSTEDAVAGNVATFDTKHIASVCALCQASQHERSNRSMQ